MTDRQKRIAAGERAHAGDWRPHEIVAHANAELAELLCHLAEGHTRGVACGCASVLVSLYWLCDTCGGDLEAAWKRASRLRAGVVTAVEAAREDGLRIHYSGADLLATMAPLMRAALCRAELFDNEAQGHQALAWHAGEMAAAIGVLALRNEFLLMDEIEKEIAARTEARNARRCH